MKAKRVKSLLLSIALVCVLVLSVGCQKAGAEKILERAKEIQNFDFDMEMVLSMSMMGQTLDMKIGADGTIVQQPLQSHMKMQIDMQGGGESINEEAEMYFEEIGNIYKVYVKNGSAWDVEEVEKDAFDSTYGTVTNAVDYSRFLAEVKNVKIVGQEKINGEDALQIECMIPAKALVDQLLTNNSLLDSMSSGVDEEEMQSIIAALGDAGDVKMNVWVDKDYYPIKYAIDMSEFMAEFLEALIAPMGDEGAMASSLVKMNAYTIEMTLSNINKTDTIKMPAQAA